MTQLGKSGSKPMRPQDHLGPDVSITRKKLESDPWAERMLREVGKALKPANHDYMGSIACHVYKSSNENLVTKEYDVATIQQISVGDMNEYLANMALANLMIEMKRYYGRNHNTTDSKDGRGKGNT